MSKPLVGIVMGSKSDAEVMHECEKVLDGFSVSYETTITSAHRNPARTRRYASGARKRGIKVVIAGAGYAAHLPGFIAAHTDLPVIGVPIPSSPLQGMDSLLSMVQMPGGVPVATMGLGRSGAKNAAIFALQVLSLGDKSIAQAMKNLRKK
ncbi:MAG: 5-(carboxyamino)imidazole ribonucleotide mutase [bacterium]